MINVLYVDKDSSEGKIKDTIRKAVKFLGISESFTKFRGVANRDMDIKYDYDYFKNKIDKGEMLIIATDSENNVRSVGLLSDEIRYLGKKEEDVYYLKHFASSGLSFAMVMINKALAIAKEKGRNRIIADCIKPSVAFSYYKRMDGVEIETKELDDGLTLVLMEFKDS